MVKKMQNVWQHALNKFQNPVHNINFI